MPGTRSLAPFWFFSEVQSQALISIEDSFDTTMAPWGLILTNCWVIRNSGILGPALIFLLDLGRPALILNISGLGFGLVKLLPSLLSACLVILELIEFARN